MYWTFNLKVGAWSPWSLSLYCNFLDKKLCSYLSLSAHGYKWVPVNIMLGGGGGGGPCSGVASHPGGILRHSKVKIIQVKV